MGRGPRGRASADQAFTLVELMIVVAIIAILAGIAIPNFIEMQTRAKWSEVPLVVDGTETAAMSYARQVGDPWHYSVPHPRADTAVDKTLVSWGTPVIPFPQPAWDDPWFGYRPDGDVRGAYSLMCNGVSCQMFVSTDVDGDEQAYMGAFYWWSPGWNNRTNIFSTSGMEGLCYDLGGGGTYNGTCY